ncbi:aminotransferase-like domain-containing protein [Amantichitinum ursilacus]|uniref:Putative 8-amino-7-oxononanoate synthase n=1 Tax=Amantichitinum ursilacus TaxID=857265 RepID=A0A0N1JSR5_9NEIS|nr:PLP-dependent aminotransferase family protein [Amantichitinum ursilacus]KPC52720.1 putative HTH-type transcriptional regulator YjiR [Amantichitinum ursilacus]
MRTLPLYHQLTNHYLDAIERGTLKHGDKMPSVRTLMSKHDISLSTALNVCRRLEEHGVLEARPRSGNYIRAPRDNAPAPAPVQPGAQLDAAQFDGASSRISALLAATRATSVKVNLAHAQMAPALYPHAALQRCMMNTLRRQSGVLGRPAPATGHPALCGLLARRALMSRMHLTPEDIIITQGGTEALNLALRAVTQPGDVVAVESPTFFGLLQTLESLNLQALEIPTDPHTGICLDALESAAQRRLIKAVVVMPNLQNPLGCVMPDAHKERLVRWCTREQIAVIEDDTYAELASQDAPLSGLKRWDEAGYVIHCASLTKSLAPGLRLGWMAPGRWRSRVGMLKYAQSRSCDLLPQLTLASFLGSRTHEQHVRQVRLQLAVQRERVTQAVLRSFPPGTQVSQPSGGAMLWVQLPTPRSVLPLFEQALQRGISFAPGQMFSSSAHFANCLRLSAGMAFTPAVDDALHRLGQMAAA